MPGELPFDLHQIASNLFRPPQLGTDRRQQPEVGDEGECRRRVRFCEKNLELPPQALSGETFEYAFLERGGERAADERELERFLASDAVSARTRDDRTLVLATWSEEGAP